MVLSCCNLIKAGKTLGDYFDEDQDSFVIYIQTHTQTFIKRKENTCKPIFKLPCDSQINPSKYYFQFSPSLWMRVSSNKLIACWAKWKHNFPTLCELLASSIHNFCCMADHLQSGGKRLSLKTGWPRLLRQKKPSPVTHLHSFPSQCRSNNHWCQNWRFSWDWKTLSQISANYLNSRQQCQPLNHC